MKRALAVIGANFGDEGKGVTVDYLCAMFRPDYVVRFNGGANAGHTVVTPAGARHVFKHFGCGTFQNIPTYLSSFFVCNPILFFQELFELHKHYLIPMVYAHPDCKITTYVDMVINQHKETKRSGKKHGSCGIGLHETMNRNKIPELTLTLGDLWNGTRADIEKKMAEIADRYARFRIGKPVDEPAAIGMFIDACIEFAKYVAPMGMAACEHPIFEGAQGLMLDRDNASFHPHLTDSKTGMHNVKLLCAQAGITDVTPYYVSRTYLTRHGAGRLPGENPALKYEDYTNLENEWQGPLRFAPLDPMGLLQRIEVDSVGYKSHLALTHNDQVPAQMACDLLISGPTRECVEDTSVVTAEIVTT